MSERIFAFFESFMGFIALALIALPFTFHSVLQSWLPLLHVWLDPRISQLFSGLVYAIIASILIVAVVRILNRLRNR